MSPLERKVDQLVARVRDLEKELVALRESESNIRRGYAEACLAAPESGDTLATAIPSVSSGTQTIPAGAASVLELVDVSGTLKLKPIQNAAGSAKKKVSYLNAGKSAATAWTTSNEPMLLLRLRSGHWIRIPTSGLSLTSVDFVSGFELSGTTLKYRTKRLNADGSITDLGLTDLIVLTCD